MQFYHDYPVFAIAKDVIKNEGELKFNDIGLIDISNSRMKAKAIPILTDLDRAEELRGSTFPVWEILAIDNLPMLIAVVTALKSRAYAIVFDPWRIEKRVRPLTIAEFLKQAEDQV